MRCVVLALVMLAACNRVPKEDAVAFLNRVEAVANASPPQDMHTTLIMIACGEVPSCGRDCAEAFRSAPQYAMEDQKLLVAQCSKDYADSARGPAKTSLGTWVRRYIGQYVMTARPKLSTDEQARLDAAIEKLGH
jgi:hypothetical protein